ncbi:MAG: OB-fold nucleic acid binding domain-containing protein [Candidatus Diapherotrites archaeon]
MPEDFDNPNSIIEKIIEKTGKSMNEVEALINEKKEKFSGLLTDSGAAFMVAKELNVKVDATSASTEFTKISKLEDGIQNVDVLVKVLQVFSAREFEKSGKKGLLCNLVVADETGEIRLTLWNKEAERIQNEQIQKGDVLMLKNCYVSSYNDRKQLSLGYSGEMIINPEEQKVDVSISENKLTKLEELKPEMSDVDSVARILRIYPATEFSHEGRKGKVLNFQISDGSAIMRATAWNDIADQVMALSENDLIKIESAYTKQGMRGLELHLGWKARIIENPKIDFEIPEADKLMKVETEKKTINQLADGDKYVQVDAKVSGIQQGRFHYKVCPTCGKKLQTLDTGYVCEKCGQIREPEINLVVGAEIEDDTGKINAVFYEKDAEKFLGFSKDEMKKKLDDTTFENLQEEFENKLKGMEFLFSGFVRANKLNEAENDFVVKRIEGK